MPAPSLFGPLGDMRPPTISSNVLRRHSHRSVFGGLEAMMGDVLRDDFSVFQPSSGQGDERDSRFLYPEARTTNDTNESPSSTPAIVSSFSSFSSVSRSGEPTLTAHRKHVTTSDGEQRNVVRRRVGDQEVVERSVTGARNLATNEVTRELINLSDDQLDDFDSAFNGSEDARTERLQATSSSTSAQKEPLVGHPRSSRCKRSKKRCINRCSTATPGDDLTQDEPERPTNDDSPQQQPRDSQSPHDAAMPKSIRIDIGDVHALRRALPELDKETAVARLKEHNGDLRAALRAALA